MTEVTWFKLKVNIFDDEKIKVIDAMPEADTIFRIWIALLTLAAKVNQNGLVYLTEDVPYTDEMLATILKRPLNTVRLALKTFEDLKMIARNKNNLILIKNFDKHQNKDGLDKIREQNKLRQQKYREKHRSLTLLDKDIDKNKDIDKSGNVTLRYKNIYNDCLLKIYTQDKINDLIFSSNKQRQQHSNLMKKLENDKLNGNDFFNIAFNDKWLKEKGLLPSLLVSQYDSIKAKLYINNNKPTEKNDILGIAGVNYD